MAKIGTVTLDDFIEKDKSNVTMVRVLLARSTLDNGIQKSYYNKLCFLNNFYNLLFNREIFILKISFLNSKNKI